MFETTKIGNIVLKNRLGVAPMTRTSASPEGFATDQMAQYYASFAHGGFGLIIVEGTYTDELFSQCYFNQPGMATDEQAKSWEKVVEAVHKAGGAIIVQLEHAGALSQGNRFESNILAPSAVQPQGEQLAFYGGEGAFPMPVEATKKDIENVIQGFVNAAVRAKSAGFDGVEIHGANGYLLYEFLTDYTNQGTDEYGGSLSNRVRLLVEVSSAVRQAVGENFIVGIRISQGKVNDYEHKWAGKEEEAKVIFQQLGQSGLDYIHVTEYEAWQPAFPDSSRQSLAELAKKYGNITVMANGHLEDPSKASQMVENCTADIITLGKGALANHNWPVKVKNDELLAIFDQEKILRPSATIKDFELVD
ncbi:NADH:flavin oxidoreductase [Paenibacillus polymyxa]|uniref:NADH:flavin oxidoreductase n=1 Tax=Paenibacillus polymyxa TaxID=1406 RepID=UPI002E0FC4F0